HPPRYISRRNGLLRRIVRHLLGRWFLLGCGGLLVLSLYLAYMKVWVPVWTFTSQHWQYGDAQIVQCDANVGHGGMSHFLAQWYHGSILLVEISEENPHAIHAYKLTPFTKHEGLLRLIVSDVNRDDKPDLLIQVDGDPVVLVLYNTGTGFTESEG